MRLALLLLVACTSDKTPTETGEPLVGPTLAHTPPVGTLTEGDSVTLVLSAEDEDGVSSAELAWRVEGDPVWETLALEDQGDGTWAGELTALEAPGLEYWFSAADAGLPSASSELPADGEDAPFSLDVLVDGAALPFYEDFEPAEGEDALFDLGWWTPSQSFPGSPWTLGEGESGYGAVHSRGVSEDQTIQDWLISPPLDLSTLDTAMVLWREKGAAVDEASHGLYISVTGRDPDAGDFIPLEAALPAPTEGDWAASQVYDLSDWVGEPVVFLAWYYEGSLADDWSVDEVEVRALAPALSASLDWSPNPVHPGETAALTVTLENAVNAGTSGLVATLSLPEGGGTLAEDTVELGDLEPLGTVEASFSLSLDPTLDDDSELPLALEVTDGLDTWSFDLTFIVGEPSTGEITLSLDEATSLIVSFGAGDPDEPSVETTVWSGAVAAGTSTLTTDLTAFHDALPPEAGPNRWFARVLPGASGSVDGLVITVGSETYEATELPALTADTEALVYVPEPPDPTLLTVSTDPSSLAPGDTEVALEIELSNNGADTQGPVTGTLSSLDEHVTVSGGEDLVIDSSTWRTGEILTLDTPTLAISADHDDSSPVTLLLELSDGLERWELEIPLEVPWPVLGVVSVEIDDEGGDGVLDPGEAAELAITVGNGGDLRTFGPLDCALAVDEGSAVSAEILAGTDSISSISEASSRETDGYEIVAGEGETGQTLALLLTLDDGTASYEAPFEIPLGERPWQKVGVTDDAAGDNVADYDFDITSVRWREQDGAISFWVASDVPYDASTLFVEAWAISTGARYTYYRLLYQSGVGKLQGYEDGFTTIGALEAELLSETELVLTLQVEDMELLLPELSIGFAAGWCGPDTYYCDHYPDDWGYPYVSFTSAEWFDLSWETLP